MLGRRFVDVSSTGGRGSAVIPTADDLADVAKRRRGTLESAPFSVLLRAYHAAKLTAVVRLERGSIVKQVVFADGVPIECESNLAHEALGRVLVHKGKLAEAHHHAALARSVNEGRSLAEVLISAGLMQSYELFRVMQQSLANKLLDLFTWRAGEVRILDDSPDVESPLRVNVGQLIVTGVLRCAPQAHVDAAIGTLVGCALGVHPAPPVSLESLRLGPKHSRAVQELRARPRLDELMQKAGLAPDEVTRLVYALALLGIVVPADALPAQPAKTATEAPVRGRAPTASSESAADGPPANEQAADLQRVRDEMMERYMRRRRGDAFDLLGVGTDVDLATLVAAYVKAAEGAAPWRFVGAVLAPVADKAEELFIDLARAYAEIADGEARARLIERRKRAAAAPFRKRSDVYAIKTELLDAAAQFAEGRALKEAGRYTQALTLLEFAADCDPQNAVYRAEAAHCRFLDGPDTQAKRALAELAEAVLADPACALAHHYAGQIRLATGDLIGARRAFEEALRVDPKHVEAQRALRGLR